MKDLFFMNDGNQTFIGREMVNFQKFRTIMGKIHALRVSQQSIYNFTFDDGGSVCFVRACSYAHTPAPCGSARTAPL